ncbi:MAG: beta-ketoacyl-[acyl-carrier-protein] synthase family protein, partial [Candidatus Adiutrix sp.]|nr:beta-ketoacyl-[acyl-carrier-protein] synthase family protein [Candidatus Adiutrix sp.]
GGFRHSVRDTLVLAEAAAAQALASAGLALDLPGKRQAGVVLGSTAGNSLHFLADYAALAAGRPVPGQGLADFYAYNPAAALAAKYGLTGPALTIGNACCSGADAVGLGGALVASGRCGLVLAGGADALSLVPYFGFRRLMIYDDQPCRPFDRDRAGLNLGEGAACLVLEDPAAAAARGARPLAILRAYAAAADAHHLTAPHPEALGLRRALRAALAQAGLTAGDLAFVNVHGTATPDNDRAEALALARELPGVPLWAAKGAIGHTLGAAGALEAALTVMALEQGRLPPSYGFSRPDPALGLSPAPPGPIHGRAGLSTSLGFGGANSVLVFENVRYE